MDAEMRLGVGRADCRHSSRRPNLSSGNISFQNLVLLSVCCVSVGIAGGPLCRQVAGLSLPSSSVSRAFIPKLDPSLLSPTRHSVESSEMPDSARDFSALSRGESLSHSAFESTGEGDPSSRTTFRSSSAVSAEAAFPAATEGVLTRLGSGRGGRRRSRDRAGAAASTLLPTFGFSFTEKRGEDGSAAGSEAKGNSESAQTDQKSQHESADVKESSSATAENKSSDDFPESSSDYHPLRGLFHRMLSPVIPFLSPPPIRSATRMTILSPVNFLHSLWTPRISIITSVRNEDEKDEESSASESSEKQAGASGETSTTTTTTTTVSTSSVDESETSGASESAASGVEHEQKTGGSATEARDQPRAPEGAAEVQETAQAAEENGTAEEATRGAEAASPETTRGSGGEGDKVGGHTNSEPSASPNEKATPSPAEEEEKETNPGDEQGSSDSQALAENEKSDTKPDGESKSNAAPESAENEKNDSKPDGESHSNAAPESAENEKSDTKPDGESDSNAAPETAENENSESKPDGESHSNAAPDTAENENSESKPDGESHSNAASEAAENEKNDSKPDGESHSNAASEAAENENSESKPDGESHSNAAPEAAENENSESKPDGESHSNAAPESAENGKNDTKPEGGNDGNAAPKSAENAEGETKPEDEQGTKTASASAENEANVANPADEKESMNSPASAENEEKGANPSEPEKKEDDKKPGDEASSPDDTSQASVEEEARGKRQGMPEKAAESAEASAASPPKTPEEPAAGSGGETAEGEESSESLSKGKTSNPSSSPDSAPPAASLAGGSGFPGGEAEPSKNASAVVVFKFCRQGHGKCVPEEAQTLERIKVYVDRNLKLDLRDHDDWTHIGTAMNKWLRDRFFNGREGKEFGWANALRGCILDWADPIGKFSPTWIMMKEKGHKPTKMYREMFLDFYTTDQDTGHRVPALVNCFHFLSGIEYFFVTSEKPLSATTGEGIADQALVLKSSIDVDYEYFLRNRAETGMSLEPPPPKTRQAVNMQQSSSRKWSSLSLAFSMVQKKRKMEAARQDKSSETSPRVSA
ncbi:hypothetical protein TGGT1_225860 [Toxoplasma gondii GT1]|uniref:Uncharacterized protein n=4 Tax=Toxoplasma gondii TaxID=5811 RepID=S7WCP4_TOXGG|nr:hypothetical protein TGGT1_225860 [Toxoplasma gondii GT1]KFG55113.1 putative clumping factor B [Toxoplasma gondii FOU]